MGRRAELESEAVPVLLLQPLVENAIRHGLGPKGGHIHVSAGRENDSIVLQVRDDGGGLAPGYRGRLTIWEIPATETG